MSPSPPLSEAERFARLRLARTDRVGPVTFRQLLDRYETAERALEALPELVRRAGGRGDGPPPVDQIEAESAAGDRIGARLIVLGDAAYPIGAVAAALLELSLAGRATLLPGGLASL